MSSLRNPEASRLASLSNEELALLVRQGDRLAGRSLVEQDLDWLRVRAHAACRRLRLESEDDALQDGVVWLCEGAGRFDPGRTKSPWEGSFLRSAGRVLWNGYLNQAR